MAKKFFKYTNINGYPLVDKLTEPLCQIKEEDPNTFLIYADDSAAAFKEALKHIYDGKPLEKFYGKYNGEKYNGEIKCVIQHQEKIY